MSEQNVFQTVAVAINDIACFERMVQNFYARHTFPNLLSVYISAYLVLMISMLNL